MSFASSPNLAEIAFFKLQGLFGKKQKPPILNTYSEIKVDQRLGQKPGLQRQRALARIRLITDESSKLAGQAASLAG